MALFLALLALLLVAGIVWTMVDVARDGYRRRPTLERHLLERRDHG